jgi:UDP-glucose 4-epimerase
MINNINKEKILVTGANGFVGLRFLEHIKHLDFDIRVLSRNPSDQYESIQCDFLKNDIPSNSLNSIDIVFHLAGFAHDLRSSSELDSIYQAINVDATVQLAELAVKNNVKTFIFLSSVKAGGRPHPKKCMNERNQGELDNKYGKSKREAELRLLKISKKSGMNVVIIRSALVYGKGMKGNLNLMLTGIKNGWFPPLPKIKNRRSMIHVDDLVEALIFVSLNTNANGEIFIVTDGRPYSSREIYDAMSNSLGKKIPKWGLPVWIFILMSKLNKRISLKLEKLLGDECYSSEKIESLGFKAKKTINNLSQNETFY